VAKMKKTILADPEYQTPGLTHVVSPNHYVIGDLDSVRVKLIKYQIENLSLKTLQMDEVGNFFLKTMSETYHLSLKFIYNLMYEKISALE
jgi:thiamine pyrophosphokinase